MPNIVIVTPAATEPLTIAEVTAFCRIDATNQEPAPSAPTATLSATPGNVDNGAHRYLVTFVTADGETQAGVPSSMVTVADKSVNGQVALTGIPIGGGIVTSRKLYRTIAGGSTYLLLATIANNTATTYTDNIADSSLGVGAPTANTTGDPLLVMLIKDARAQAEHVLGRYLVTQTLDAYFDELPDADEEFTMLLPPLQSVTSITYTDSFNTTQTLSPTEYVVDETASPATITPAYGKFWPYAIEQAKSVKVRLVAGYGTATDVPACIKRWMLMNIKTAWDGRDQLGHAMGNPVIDQLYIDRLLDSERVGGRTC